MLGFKDLTGIDLFCGSSDFNIKFMQCDIFDKRLGVYDLITLHHSFEHMDNPDEILSRIRQILSPNGVCLIRIPISECLAWNEYMEDWYEIDPPRHYFIYSEKSFEDICKRNGLEVKKLYYDSTPKQFIISKYFKETSMPMREVEDKITKEEMDYYQEKTDRANINKCGDTAAFIVKKIKK